MGCLSKASIGFGVAFAALAANAAPAGGALRGDVGNWTTFKDGRFGFEVKHPRNWQVSYDDARFPGGGSFSVPRFTISRSDKDPLCYASILFRDPARPDKLTYSLSADKKAKDDCQKLLDRVVATFRLNR